MSITIQIRGGVASERASKNPILSERELAFETDTRFMKFGDGVTPYNDLTYQDIRPIAEATVLQMEGQNTPTTPPPGKMNFFAKDIAGRIMPRVQGPSGLMYPLQPSFFQNYIFVVSPNITTSLSSIGDSVTAVGTISHPVATEAYGRMGNIMSAATANITAGVSSANLIACRGSIEGANGFFYNSRVAYPDANYDTTGAGIGTRIFSGMTDSTLASVITADRCTAVNVCGFLRTHTPTLQDTNWQFITRDGAGVSVVDTGLPFYPQKVYDMFIFSAPQATKIGWRIDNITDGTTITGEVTTNLPQNTSRMRCGAQIITTNAVSRNMRLQRLYLESDR